MSEVTLAEIVEVVETGTRGANVLLAQGYVLLAIIDHAEAKVMIRGDGNPQPYVQRFSTYSLGRPAGIPHREAPRFERRETGADAAAHTAGEPLTTEPAQQDPEAAPA